MDLTAVAKILQVGLAGLAFLLAFLAYQLISVEQRKKSPDRSILSASNRFMWFALSLGLLTGVAQLGEVALKSWLATREIIVPRDGGVDVNAINQSLISLRDAVASVNHRIDGIRLNVANTRTSAAFGCGGEQRAEEKTLTVMFGSRDGTSCGVPNLNYYKELELQIPR